MTLPHLTSVQDADTVSLTEMETILYGARNHFVIDLGNKRSITLACKRVNPPSWNDSSSDPERWSNAKWWDEFQDMIDDWQVVMGDEGGFTLTLESPDESLFPSFTGSDALNVFLVGGVSPTFGVQTLSFTLPLVCSRITDGEAYEMGTATVIYHANLESYGIVLEDVVETVTAEVQFVLKTMPSEWKDAYAGATVRAWATSESSTAYEYEPGSIHEGMEEGETVELWARWAESYSVVLTESRTLYPEPGWGRLVAYLVGGGGGAGGSGTYVFSESIETVAYTYASACGCGGGGGSGALKVTSVGIDSMSTLRVEIGEGGGGGSAHESNHTLTEQDPATGGDGEDGGATILYVDDTVRGTANGGGGGRGGTGRVIGSGRSLEALVTGGGQGGGESTDTTAGRGGDGSGDESSRNGSRAYNSTAGEPGKGFEGTTDDTSSTFVYYHTMTSSSAGGGAAPLDIQAMVDGVLEPYVSVGADGADPSSGADVGTAGYGGGGGSGAAGGGDGAPGIAILTFFRSRRWRTRP